MIRLPLTLPSILNRRPFRYRFVRPGRLLLQPPVCCIRVDAQREPGAVRAQLRRGVLLLLVLHDLQPAEQTRRRKAFDDVLIWGRQGPAEAQEQWRWTEQDICKDSGWIVAGGSIAFFHHWCWDGVMWIHLWMTTFLALAVNILIFFTGRLCSLGKKNE